MNNVLRAESEVSMEPRFFNHGDGIDSSSPRKLSRARFQWSHGFSTMETMWIRFSVFLQRTSSVSMEPRFFNHGDTTTSKSTYPIRHMRFNGATVFQPWRPVISGDAVS